VPDFHFYDLLWERRRRTALLCLPVAMEWYGIGAAALLGLSFCFARHVRWFLASAAATLAGFVAATASRGGRGADWYLMAAGLLATAAGLAIARVMLVRSVSLRLLGRIDGGAGLPFDDEIGARLRDMRAFGLVRATDRGNTLTPLGRAVAGAAAPLCRAPRVAR